MGTSTTARDVILNIAKGFDCDDADEYIKNLTRLKRHDPEVLKLLKRSRQLEKTMKQNLFPVAGFVVRSKIVRQKRQDILNRLTAQHIVCLRLNDDNLVKNIEKELEENQQILEQAKQRALDQEEKLFKACSTNQEYHTKSINVTAIDWYKVSNLLPAQTLGEETEALKQTVKEKPSMVSKKRKVGSLLLDSDIDWENGIRDSDARKNGFRKRLKPVIIDLLEEAIPNNISPELKVKLVNDIIDDTQNELFESGDYISTERMKEKLKPFIRKATETISFSQSIYYTT